ncbi:MAG: hypothetical protein AB1679_09030 [Actinomycetota bacterium]|jgi:hypothetical protein
MSAGRATAFAVASSLLVVAVGPTAAAASTVDQPSSGMSVAAPGNGESYLHKRGHEQVGRRCTPRDAEVAGGTIVGAGGQVVAGGGGTGVGCETFYAYEVRTGEPQTAVPWAEPSIYLRPGGSISR